MASNPAIYVADTHALIFLWSGSPALGTGAARAFADVANGKAVILVPTIVPIEIRYKEEKGNDPSFPAGITAQALAFVDGQGFQWAALDIQVATQFGNVPRSAVPDMPDRIIAATALASGAPLITKDSKIIAWGGVSIVW